MNPIWIWQRMQSPHMTSLANGLARLGVPVTFCAQQSVLAERARDGWAPGELVGVERRLVSDAGRLAEAVAAAPREALHLTEGMRRNGMVGRAQKMLADRRARIWWMLEGIDERGPKRLAKMLDYRLAITRRIDEAERVLSFGDDAGRWMTLCGYPANRILPFAYFLQASRRPAPRLSSKPFRVLFVGRMIELKRFDLLVDALAPLMKGGIELAVMGDGVMGPQLHRQARQKLPQGSLKWLGSRPAGEVRDMMRMSDVLVLPSDYDGWGAVASEALIEGTRVICSDACGARVVVRKDEGSQVFPAGNREALTMALRTCMDAGPVSFAERERRVEWSRCLTADVGAAYLVQLVKEGMAMSPPWIDARVGQERAA